MNPGVPLKDTSWMVKKSGGGGGVQKPFPHADVTISHSILTGPLDVLSMSPLNCRSSSRSLRKGVADLVGPNSTRSGSAPVPFLFWGEGSSTNIDYRKKLVPTYSMLSNPDDLEIRQFFHRSLSAWRQPGRRPPGSAGIW